MVQCYHIIRVRHLHKEKKKTKFSPFFSPASFEKHLNSLEAQVLLGGSVQVSRGDQLQGMFYTMVYRKQSFLCIPHALLHTEDPKAEKRALKSWLPGTRSICTYMYILRLLCVLQCFVNIYM